MIFLIIAAVGFIPWPFFIGYALYKLKKALAGGSDDPGASFSAPNERSLPLAMLLVPPICFRCDALRWSQLFNGLPFLSLLTLSGPSAVSPFDFPTGLPLSLTLARRR